MDSSTTPVSQSPSADPILMYITAGLSLVSIILSMVALALVILFHKRHSESIKKQARIDFGQSIHPNSRRTTIYSPCLDRQASASILNQSSTLGKTDSRLPLTQEIGEPVTDMGAIFEILDDFVKEQPRIPLKMKF